MGNIKPCVFRMALHNSGIGIWRQDYSHIGLIVAPVPLTAFHSNSRLDQNLKCSSLKHAQLIKTKFWHVTTLSRRVRKILWWSVEDISPGAWRQPVRWQGNISFQWIPLVNGAEIKGVTLVCVLFAESNILVGSWFVANASDMVKEGRVYLK